MSGSFAQPAAEGPSLAGDSPPLRSRPAPARCRSARRSLHLASQAAPRNPPHRYGSPANMIGRRLWPVFRISLGR